MSLIVNNEGWITGDSSIRITPRPAIEHGVLHSIQGIIVHQTDSRTIEATLSSYLRPGANGAHFLIGKDGATYQVASLKKKTWHVGKLRAKCLETHSCAPVELKARKPSEVERIEMLKSVPSRFPSNSDSLGIELVGRCILDPKFIRPSMSADQIETIRANKGVYETVTPAQNIALRILIRKIQSGLHVPEDQVFTHPRVSRKNATEAATARWTEGQ